MAKPILFDSISRSKFDALTEKSRNYQVKESDGKTVSKYIANLIVEGGGGSDLPEVSASDSGKVLTVDSSGNWGAAEPQGGGAGGQLKTVGLTTVQISDEYKYFTLSSASAVDAYIGDDDIYQIDFNFDCDGDLLNRKTIKTGVIEITEGVIADYFNFFGSTDFNGAALGPTEVTGYTDRYELVRFGEDWK